MLEILIFGGQKIKIITRHQNFDYTMIADRLRKVSWSSDSHPAGGINTHWISWGSISDWPHFLNRCLYEFLYIFGIYVELIESLKDNVTNPNPKPKSNPKTLTL